MSADNQHNELENDVSHSRVRSDRLMIVSLFAVIFLFWMSGIAWFVASQYDSVGPLNAIIGLFLGSVSMTSFWLVFSNMRLFLRINLVGFCDISMIALVLVAIYMIQNAPSPPEILVVLVYSVVLLRILFVIPFALVRRFCGWKLTRGVSTSLATSERVNQIAIGDLFVSMTLAAVALVGLQVLRSGYEARFFLIGPGQIRYLFIFTGFVGLHLIVVGPWFLILLNQQVKYLPVIVAGGLAIGETILELPVLNWILGRSGGGPLFYFTLNLSPFLLILTSLLIVRWCGYRLIRTKGQSPN